MPGPIASMPMCIKSSHPSPVDAIKRMSIAFGKSSKEPKGGLSQSVGMSASFRAPSSFWSRHCACNWMDGSVQEQIPKLVHQRSSSELVQSLFRAQRSSELNRALIRAHQSLSELIKSSSELMYRTCSRNGMDRARAGDRNQGHSVYRTCSRNGMDGSVHEPHRSIKSSMPST